MKNEAFGKARKKWKDLSPGECREINSFWDRDKWFFEAGQKAGVKTERERINREFDELYSEPRNDPHESARRVIEILNPQEASDEG